MQSTPKPSLWARFLDAATSDPNPDRLVRVAEVDRAALSLAEGSMADVHLFPVIQELPGRNGDSRFMILVSERDAETASAVLAGI